MHESSKRAARRIAELEAENERLREQLRQKTAEANNLRLDTGALLREREDLRAARHILSCSVGDLEAE